MSQAQLLFCATTVILNESHESVGIIVETRVMIPIPSNSTMSRPLGGARGGGATGVRGIRGVQRTYGALRPQSARRGRGSPAGALRPQTARRGRAAPVGAGFRSGASAGVVRGGIVGGGGGDITIVTVDTDNDSDSDSVICLGDNECLCLTDC
ncbi:unnamed protein product [Rotaria magnacalcarata]|uniref:Uncharacterized protein n=1 Tax=Rotaria magnacalcarata TaxID=392030 RepID=A0A815FQ71_9BILA|nr:unnamed protein product [Rotaria magnacalcarata]CAF1329526.1 unnamed protein product [Rotaria magnacalcarata]CAF2069717.1 unnamed protein product [Rotaria magnacalcarata]CAF2157933.1 unnamed protein product [Rotaria magnacalcarata]CAF2268080.1 unnamed protein product [Rotaria magnacalcarata]